jgi:DNA/RNA-binding domain of Phe-tRNA-synthetase-like protein
MIQKEDTMLTISASQDWYTNHTGGIIGLLELSGVDNNRSSHRLEVRKRETETHLREQYAGFTRPDFLALPIMTAYDNYYKKFNKTYHVQLQLESIVLKGKSLPNVSPLVDANFTAEVDTLVLTAGHDVAKLHAPILFDVSREGDEITQMSGEAKAMRPGDMLMKDAEGICCSIIYGQDNRSPITPESTHVLYVSYAPPGVPAEAVEAQLRQIEEHIRLFSRDAVVEQHQLLTA